MASDGRLGRECYGAIPHFPMNTIWFEHIDVDEDHPPTFDLNWEDPYFKIVLALHHAVLKEAGKDNFLVGQGCFMPGNDMLALVIGTQEMLTSMHDRPEWTRNAILQLARNWLTRCFSAMTGRSRRGWTDRRCSTIPMARIPQSRMLGPFLSKPGRGVIRW